MNIEDIKDYLTNNKENESVQELLRGLQAPSEIKDYDQYFQQNESAAKWLQSVTDSRVTKGIETFKTNKMPTLIKEELQRMNQEDLSPDQLKIKELADKLERLEREKEREALKNYASKTLADTGLSIDFVPYIMSDNKEKLEENIKGIQSILLKSVETEVSKRLKGATPVAPKGGDDKQVTKEKLNKMSYLDRAKFAQSNPDLYQELTK